MEERTTSQPPSAHGGDGAPAGAQEPVSSNRGRNGEGSNGARPADEALQSRTEAYREYRKYERREEEDRAGPVCDLHAFAVDALGALAPPHGDGVSLLSHRTS